MTHKAWCTIEKVPYYFSRSSIKFQGHTGWKIDNLNPICIRLLGRLQLSNLRFALFLKEFSMSLVSYFSPYPISESPWCSIWVVQWSVSDHAGRGPIWSLGQSVCAKRLHQTTARWVFLFLVCFSSLILACFLAETKNSSVRLSVSVTPFLQCSSHLIIMKFSGVVTTNIGYVHAKGQGQRSRSQRWKQILPQFGCFPDCNSSLNSQMATKWCTKLEKA